ncbi:MAG: type I methionyl aminopeptidase [Thermodesulfobacteriota bacterium]|nr:type I methionyl aminopeptidase [Thermodesulfobacteriota bacterium]
MKKKNSQERINRNTRCPCGSGLKYKKCCLNRDTGDNRLEKLYLDQYNIRVKTAADVAGIKAAGRLALELLDMAESMIEPGVTTDAINAVLHDHTVKHSAVPAPLNYRGFPKSVCISINDEICHGIPGDRVIQDGDIVNVDVTPILNGYYADVNKTFFAGTPGEDARRIVKVTRGSLRAAIEKVSPGTTLGDIGWTIQQYVEQRGCSVVREFVGHGVGFDFHEHPQVPHYGDRGKGIKLIPGMVFTIEPMINLGAKEMRILENEWTAVTRDGSLSAQFEQTLLVTDDGCESLTPFDL